MDTIAVTIDLPLDLHEQLQEIMVVKKCDLHSLILHYLKEGIGEDLMKAKQKRFQRHAEEVMKAHAMPAPVIAEIVEKFDFKF